jgi:hypothetical protein
MRLTEQQAAQTVLVRSIEECDSAAFPGAALSAALETAKHEEPGLAWVEKRAAHLYAYLPDAYRSVLKVAKLPGAWTLPICVSVLMLGLATNLLGPAEKIHVIRNPVFILVAWNLFVYLALFVVTALRMFRKSASSAGRSSQAIAGNDHSSGPRHANSVDAAKVPWSVRLVLPAIWRLVRESKVGSREAKTLPAVTAHFAANWFVVARPLVVARWKRLLHLGALFLSVGAVAGMYIRGLFQDYEVVWTSTFVRREETLSAIIQALFGPSLFVSDLIGLHLASDINITRLLSSTGDKADAWIHLFALTVGIAVVIPRASLALWQSLRIRQLRSTLALPLDSYYGQVIEAPLRSAVAEAVEKAAKDFARDITTFILASLYEERIVPALHGFRQQGGRLTDLRSEITRLSEAFTPELHNYIASISVPQLQTRVSQRVGAVVKSVETDFVESTHADRILSDLEIPAAQAAELGVAGSVSKAVGISVGTAVSVAFATIGGGVGHHLGIALIATLLGTTGPIGFLIGLMVGAVVTAGAWLFGREKLAEAIENLPLPAAAVRTVLWESRFYKLLDEGRQKFEQAAEENVTARLKTVVPTITDQVMARLRTLWAS